MCHVSLSIPTLPDFNLESVHSGAITVRLHNTNNDRAFIVHCHVIVGGRTIKRRCGGILCFRHHLCWVLL